MSKILNGPQFSAMTAVLSEVAHERERQHEKWGEQDHPDGTGDPFFAQLAQIAKRSCDSAAGAGKLTYLDIAMEEFYEAAAEGGRAPLRKELIQAAAVFVAWVEKLDRDELKERAAAQ